MHSEYLDWKDLSVGNPQSEYAFEGPRTIFTYRIVQLIKVFTERQGYWKASSST